MITVNGTAVNAAWNGGSLLFMVRAADRATFDAVAKSVGLLVHQSPGAPAVTDPETGETIREAVEPSGPLVPARGVTIARLGPMVLVPGEYDEEGNEITPPTLDERYHVNFWLPPRVVEGNEWQTWATAWTQNGEPVADTNKNESALIMNGIELIDPATVTSPSNVLLGFE